jgi:hypothetical protein
VMLQVEGGVRCCARSWVDAAMLTLCCLRFSGARLELHELGVLFLRQGQICRSTRLY